MASFNSILGNIGHGFKVFFVGATHVAQVAEPIIDIAFPGIAMLYNTTVNAVINAENAAIAAGAQSGSGPQKLALVVSSIEDAYNAYAKANGIVPIPANVTAWANAVVATLNSIPSLLSAAGSLSPTQPAPAPSVQTQAASGVLL